MRALFLVCVVSLCAEVLGIGAIDDPSIWFRGDVDMNGTINVSDPIKISNWLFSGGPEPLCLNQADADNSGSVGSTDVVYLYSFLFSGGPPPASPNGNGIVCVDDDVPFPGCNTDPCS